MTAQADGAIAWCGRMTAQSEAMCLCSLEVQRAAVAPIRRTATEARRADGVLADPDSVRIMEGLDYDFAGHSGVPGGAFAGREAQIDRCVAQWREAHPDELVVSLGEGLETQSRRVDNGRVRWLSVDLLEAIRLRELFLPPTERFRHLAMNALDPGWIAAVGRLFGAMAAGLAGPA
jgi:O-methyltransferase involved in polyketide biosynthesis